MGQIIDIRPLSCMERQLGLIAKMIEEGTKRWRQELGDIDDDCVVWQPFPNGHSIGAVILHVSDVEQYWIQEVALSRARTRDDLRALYSLATDQNHCHWPAPPKRPLFWYLALHDHVRKTTLCAIEQFGQADRLARVGESAYSIRWILHHLMFHESYHGGQAVLLAANYARYSGTPMAQPQRLPYAGQLSLGLETDNPSVAARYQGFRGAREDRLQPTLQYGTESA